MIFTSLRSIRILGRVATSMPPPPHLSSPSPFHYRLSRHCLFFSPPLVHFVPPHGRVASLLRSLSPMSVPPMSPVSFNSSNILQWSLASPLLSLPPTRTPTAHSYPTMSRVVTFTSLRTSAFYISETTFHPSSVVIPLSLPASRSWTISISLRGTIKIAMAHTGLCTPGVVYHHSRASVIFSFVMSRMFFFLATRGVP